VGWFATVAYSRAPLESLTLGRGILDSVQDTETGATMRRAAAADVAALVDLQRQIYREERWFVGDGPPSVAALAQRLRGSNPRVSLWLVADCDRSLCGWLELHRLPPARLDHVATLTLAVAPGWRHQGIGRALLEQGFQWAKQVGVRKITLNVRAGNDAAIGLYRAQGFELEGRERQQIRTSEGFEDNLIMARFL
jgi:ribosomal protein S18 acetylase RimI-like enzyme